MSKTLKKILDPQNKNFHAPNTITDLSSKNLSSENSEQCVFTEYMTCTNQDIDEIEDRA